MKLLIYKIKYAFLFILILCFLTNYVYSSCNTQLNPNEDEVVAQLHTFLNTKPETGFCSLSEEKMKDMCKSISEEKIKYWASLNSFTIKNIIYIPSENSEVILYTCEREEFHYTIISKDEIPVSITDHLFMYTCPGYEVDIEFEDSKSTHQKKISFKVAEGEEKNTAYVFQGSVHNSNYLKPMYYATDLNYE